MFEKLTVKQEMMEFAEKIQANARDFRQRAADNREQAALYDMEARDLDTRAAEYRRLAELA